MFTCQDLLQPLRITITEWYALIWVRKEESLESWAAAVQCWLVGRKGSGPFAPLHSHFLSSVFSLPVFFPLILSMFSNVSSLFFKYFFFPLKQTPPLLPIQPGMWTTWPWCKGTVRTTILIHHPWRPCFNPQLRPPAWKLASSGLIVSMT